jgi:hypothetical protein
MSGDALGDGTGSHFQSVAYHFHISCAGNALQKVEPDGESADVFVLQDKVEDRRCPALPSLPSLSCARALVW